MKKSKQDNLKEDKRYNLNDKITDNEFFQILKEAKRHNWDFSFVTDLDELGFRNADHDDIDLRDKFEEIKASGDIYAITGFIIIECLEVKSLKIFDGENTIIFFENVIHFNGDTDKFEQILMYLSLNPDYWINWLVDNHQ